MKTSKKSGNHDILLEEVNPQVSFLYMKQTILLLIRIFQRRQV